MQDADDDAWGKAGPYDIPLYYTETKDLKAWSKRNARKKGVLEVLWRGAACTCGAGASHVMCVVVPALAGGVTGGAGGLLSSAWAMYAISPALAIAVNAGIDHVRQIKKDTWSQIRGAAVTGVIAVGLTGAINYATGHEHFDPAKLAELNARTGIERVEWLADYQLIHESMDRVLQAKVAQAAADKGLSPAEYISICSGTDPLGEEISKASRAYWSQKSTELGLANAGEGALNNNQMLQYNVSVPR